MIYLPFAKDMPQDYDRGVIQDSLDDLVIRVNNILNDMTSAPLIDHNSLGGKQGGTTGQYYHLTLAQVTALHAALTLSSLTGFTLTGQQLSYTANYSLPLTADTGKGVTAYGWGNHASAGYLTTITGLSPSFTGLTISTFTTAGVLMNAVTTGIVSSANAATLKTFAGYYTSGDSPSFASVTIDSSIYNSHKGVSALGRNIWIGGGGQSSVGTTGDQGSYNSSLGWEALDVLTTGAYNVAIGSAALVTNTIGSGNVAMGHYALGNNLTGGYNVGIGYNAGLLNVDGLNSVAVGTMALYNNLGNGSVGIGHYAGTYEAAGNSFFLNNIDQVNLAGDRAYSLLWGSFAGTAGTVTGNILRLNGTLLITPLTTAGILHNTVTTGEITSSKIVNADITGHTIAYASLQEAYAPCLLGKFTAGAGDITELALDLADTTKYLRKDGTFQVPGVPALTSAHIFVGNGSNVATDVAVTGDISIDNAGLTAIASGVIVDADINASAAIATTKLGTGAVVQVVNYQRGDTGTGTTQIPIDNSIPQKTEGDQWLTVAITPKSTTNKLLIEVKTFTSSSSANSVTVALFQDAISNALCASCFTQFTANGINPQALTYNMVSGTTSAINFYVRIGAGGAGTTTYNGASGAAYMGGVLYSSITITEIVA